MISLTSTRNSKMITYKRKRKREAPRTSSAHNQGEHHETQDREIAVMGFRLLELPSSIILEVITRMPVKEVIQCRRTCKTLCRLISEPSFNKSFLLKSPVPSFVHHSFLRNDIQFVRLVRRYDDFSRSLRSLQLVSKRQIPRSNKLEIVGSSNGLLCLCDKSSLANTLYLTNPLLGESVVLPKPSSDKFVAINEAYWFGYIPKMGIYKVIRVKVRRALIQSNPRKFYKKSEVHVLIIGTDTWKYVGDAPFPLYGKFSMSILNGCIYWLANDLHLLQVISFNIEEDRFYTFPSLPKLENKCLHVELGVMGNNLCLSGCTPDFAYVEIWKMHDYGVASSWTRHQFFKSPFSTAIFLIDGQRITAGKYGMLISYDPQEKKHTGIINLGLKRRFVTMYFRASFISLTHLFKGTCFRVKHAKSYIT